MMTLPPGDPNNPQGPPSPGSATTLLRRRWSGLSLQLSLFVLLPLTLLLLLVAIGGSLLHQQAMRRLVGERDLRAARAAAAAIEDQLQQRAAALENLAHAAASQATDPPTTLGLMSPLLSDFDAGLALFDAAGNQLAATAFAAGVPATAVPLAWPAPSHAPGQQPTFHTVATGGETIVLISARAGDIIAAGAFSAAAQARSALSRIYPTSALGSAFVVTPAGEIIYQAGAPASPAQTILQHPGVVSGLRGESGAATFSAGDDDYIVAFSPIAPLGWALVVEESWHAVAGPLLHTTEYAPLILVPLPLITLAALAFGARQVVQPLQTLAERASALAWGDFSAIEQPVGGIAEIERLQTDLIHMARKVRHAQESLRGYLSAVTHGQEEERRRLARELHDDAIQSLIALNQRIQLTRLAAGSHASAAASAPQLDEMQQMVAGLIAALRRHIHALRPIYLEDLGLLPALQMLAAEVQKAHGLPVAFHREGAERRLPSAVELALYRIAQEALNNVVRHAQAAAAQLSLSFNAHEVTLTVRDDGAGFHPPQSPAQLAPQGHYGLLGIHERAQLIGAQLTLQSQPGAGTDLQVTVPHPHPHRNESPPHKPDAHTKGS